MKILYILAVWPEPEASAAGTRTADLLHFLRRGGHRVTVVSPCQKNPARDRLEAQGFPCEQCAPNDSRFNTLVQALQPEAVIFDRFNIEEQFSWRVREVCPEALRILDTVDLHFLRRGRQRAAALHDDVRTLPPEEIYSPDALRELAAIYRSDLSLIISDVEQRLLEDTYRIPAPLIAHLPFSCTRAERVPSFHERRHCVTIGNFNHAPNLDSFELLRNSLWARIQRALTSAGAEAPELHIYGSYPPEEFSRYDSPATGLRVMGVAPDAHAALSRYRLNLAPLRFGAGIKGKILAGWAVGTPCVATLIAAEGMLLQGAEGVLFGGKMAQSLDEFASDVSSLYTDPAVWEEAQKVGFATLERNFNRQRNERDFLAMLEESLRHKADRRAQNTVGALLWYQGHRSTEYFSRWIEEKGRKR